VAQPLIGRRGPLFGAVAAGTGNDFIHILGYPDRLNDAQWEGFFQCSTADMDVGRCNGMYFINGMGLGFDAQVAAENYTGDEAHEVRLGRKSKYLWHILKTLLFYRERPMWALTAEGRQEMLCFMNTIAIGRRFAGSYHITPRAIADDGLLDVCSVREVSLLERLSVFLKTPKGLHIGMKPIRYYQTESLDLEFAEKVPYHLDGELYFDTHFKISLLPKALSVIYNPAGAHYFGAADA
jgi:diacylglycerol kinase family enzyme